MAFKLGMWALMMWNLTFRPLLAAWSARENVFFSSVRRVFSLVSLRVLECATAAQRRPFHSQES